MNRLPGPSPRILVSPSVGRMATRQLVRARKTPSATTMRRTALGRAPIACMTPNSRVRSRMLALIVVARPMAPTTPKGKGAAQQDHDDGACVALGGGLAAADRCCGVDSG